MNINDEITVMHLGRACQAFVMSIYADGIRYRVKRFEVRGINDERERFVGFHREDIEWARGWGDDIAASLRAAHALADPDPVADASRGMTANSLGGP